jgi:ABC-type transporter Mla subunit MlaD
MTDIILGVGVAAFIVYAGFHLSYILSIRRTSERMGDFLQNTEGNLNAALVELKDTLENLKKITGNVNAVSEDVRQISRTVAIVEKSIRGLYAYGRGNLGPAAGANIAGLKAGISTGVSTLVKNFKQRRRVHHERKTGS